jgi:PPOX class probable F420-dependent enzyme
MIPEAFLDLVSDSKPVFCYLGTAMADGTPQVTPVWFNWDGKNFLINTAKGRTKDRNMRRKPDVALLIADPSNPYRYLQIVGKVVEITEEGADEHIWALAKKYTGKDWNGAPGETRVIFRIEPVRIIGH